MKNIIFSVVFLFLFAFGSFAQNDSIQDIYTNKHEIKLNGLVLLAGAFEVSYERNLTESSSAGISAFKPFDSENFDLVLNYYVSPYYRMFFGEKYASGFFVEGFGMVSSYDDLVSSQTGSELEPIITTTEGKVINIALGFGLGGKWVKKSGFVYELSAGVGRNFINNLTNDDDYDVVGKVGFSVGFRF